MIQFDSPFSSCHGLQELFKPLSADLVALQMSRGPLQGRLRIYQLGAIRFNLLETNQSLFLSGTWRSTACTLAVPLNDVDVTSPSRAQAIPVSWPALMGYNQQLTNFYLKVPAGSRLATIVIGKDVLLEHLARLGASQLSLERWKSTNQLGTASGTSAGSAGSAQPIDTRGAEPFEFKPRRTRAVDRNRDSLL